MFFFLVLFVATLAPTMTFAEVMILGRRNVEGAGELPLGTFQQGDTQNSWVEHLEQAGLVSLAAR